MVMIAVTVGVATRAVVVVVIVMKGMVSRNYEVNCVWGATCL